MPICLAWGTPQYSIRSVRGIHAVGLFGIILSLLAIRGTELYTHRFQSLPALDWLESRPPFTESTDVPPASDLARGLARTMPLLVVGEDARPWLPVFGPPAAIQRSMGSVRDASRIVLVSPGAASLDGAPITVRLYTVVFSRTLRAEEWTELMGREMDIRDPDSGLTQARITGPDEADSVWVVSPRQTGGIATIVGHRGPVGFDLQVTLGPRQPVFSPESNSLAGPESLELSARAESLARQSAGAWSAWVNEQLSAA